MNKLCDAASRYGSSADISDFFTTSIGRGGGVQNWRQSEIERFLRELNILSWDQRRGIFLSKSFFLDFLPEIEL